VRDFFRELFSFSRREKIGIYVLLTLIFLLIGFRYFYLPRQHFGREVDHSCFKEEVFSFKESLKKVEQNKSKRANTFQEIDDVSKTINRELFNFNPNKLDRNGWKKLGLRERIIDIIENYRKSGGVFQKKKDLLKIYGLDQAHYERLKPYIILPDRADPKDSHRTQKNFKKKENEYFIKDTSINLNKADTFNLMLVHGIGPYYAKRICKYRDLLGGFSNIEQLKEVYGINDTVYNKINASLKIDTSEIEKIHLNNATFNNLIRHPYINAYQTKAIMKYIDYKGSIQSKKELVENNILDKQTYKKVSIYLEP